MKKNLRMMTLSAIAVIMFCALNSFAQARVGGYKSVATDDAAVIEAAEFAANTQSDRSNRTINIEVIKKAYRQTVAGANYKICMQVAVAEEGEQSSVQFVQAIVFYSLQRQYTLKSWARTENCD